MATATEGNKVSLADATIEQIEQMALDQINAEAGNDGKGDAGDAKDVSKAPSGQSQEKTGAATEVKAKDEHAGESDKEANFAALRTKLRQAEEDKRRLEAENERILAEHAAKQPDVKAQVAEVDGRLTQLADKFQDGEITWEDYQAELTAANAQRMALIEEAAKATARVEITKEQREKEAKDAQETANAEWQKTSGEFINAEHDGIKYSEDDEKFKTLNTIIKALASDPENSERTPEWYLETAHAAVKAKFGIASAATAKDEKQVAAVKPKEQEPFNSLGEIPGGIAPARNEVEQLDQLSGAALTNRFLNMTQKQIDAELAKLA